MRRAGRPSTAQERPTVPFDKWWYLRVGVLSVWGATTWILLATMPGWVELVVLLAIYAILGLIWWRHRTAQERPTVQADKWWYLRLGVYWFLLATTWILMEPMPRWLVLVVNLAMYAIVALTWRHRQGIRQRWRTQTRVLRNRGVVVVVFLFAFVLPFVVVPSWR